MRLIKRKNKPIAALAALLVAACLSGCGSASSFDGAYVGSDYSSKGMSNGIDMESSAYYGDDSSSARMSEADIVKNTMMIARTANLSVDVANLEEFQSSLEDLVSEYSGYFESATVNSYEYDYQDSRYAYFTVRIPKASLDEFLSYMDGNTVVTSKNVTAEDVSLEYVDVEAKIAALEKEKARLGVLAESAESVSDLIQIEERLSSVQYELDSYNSRRTLLEGRVEYSSVTITAHEERSIEHPLRKAFAVNFKERFADGMETTVNFFVGLAIALPMIVGITAFAILFAWVLKKVLRKVFKKDRSVRYVLMPVALGQELEPQAKATEPNEKQES